MIFVFSWRNPIPRLIGGLFCKSERKIVKTFVLRTKAGFLHFMVFALIALLIACENKVPEQEADCMARLLIDPDKQTAGTESIAKKQFAWYVPASHPFFDKVRDGVQAFEFDTGIKVFKQVGPDWSAESQARGIKALVNSGYRYFSVYPASASDTNLLYLEIAKLGAVAANFGASTLLPTKAAFFIGTPIKEAAKYATEILIKNMGGSGSILNVLEVLEDANTALRKEGIEEIVAKYPGVNIIQEIGDIQSQDEAVAEVGKAFATNIGRIDGIIATGGNTSVGMARILTQYFENGGTKKINSVGIDDDPILEKAILSGYVDGTIIQNTFAQGYISMMLLRSLSEGRSIKEGKYFFSTGMLYVDKENMDSYSNILLRNTRALKMSLKEYLQ